MTVNKYAFGQTVLITDAYHRVESIGGNKDNLTFKLVSYDGICTHEVSDNFYNFKPSVADDAFNFIKQCYEYLKTLDEYADAVDC